MQELSILTYAVYSLICVASIIWPRLLIVDFFTLEIFLILFETYVVFRFQEIESVHLRMPNLHFVPVNLSSKENPNMVKVRFLLIC
jgi:hypothetical protein